MKTNASVLCCVGYIHIYILVDIVLYIQICLLRHKLKIWLTIWIHFEVMHCMLMSKCCRVMCPFFVKNLVDGGRESSCSDSDLTSQEIYVEVPLMSYSSWPNLRMGFLHPVLENSVSEAGENLLQGEVHQNTQYIQLSVQSGCFSEVLKCHISTK